VFHDSIHLAVDFQFVELLLPAFDSVVGFRRPDSCCSPFRVVIFFCAWNIS